MSLVRTSILASILTAGGLALAAGPAHAQDAGAPAQRPAMPAFGPGAPTFTPPATKPAESGFMHWFFKEGPRRSSRKDWSTGRDDRLSKPWLKPIH